MTFEGKIFTSVDGKIRAQVGTFKDEELDEKLDYLKEAFRRDEVFKIELVKL